MSFAPLDAKRPILPSADDVPAFIEIDGKTLGLEFKRSPRARRYILTVRPDRTVLVTLPTRGSLNRAREFVNNRRPWLQRVLGQFPKQLPPKLWTFDTEIWFRGRLTRIELAKSNPTPTIRLGIDFIEITALEHDLRPALEASLRNTAAIELSKRVCELAQIHECVVRRIRIGNQRSRWGSCSRRGTVSLNWRLIQVPNEVRDYIVLHELMHLREMNHSDRFWSHVARVCPEYQQAEAWLKAHPFLLNI